jgi:hypothetical protein
VGQRKLLDEAIIQFEKNENWDIPPTKIFISVGKNEGSSMIPGMVKFSLYLENADYENIDLTMQIFDGESHNSALPGSISKTITTLYGKK